MHKIDINDILFFRVEFSRFWSIFDVVFSQINVLFCQILSQHRRCCNLDVQNVFFQVVERWTEGGLKEEKVEDTRLELEEEEEKVEEDDIKVEEEGETNATAI